jgi:hypothetical protein
VASAKRREMIGPWRPAGGRLLVGRQVVTEGDMNGFNWNSLIQALVLVRIGQELGTESRLARAIHDVVHALGSVWQ